MEICFISSSKALFFTVVTFSAPSVGVLVGILVLIALLLVSCMISGSEVAFFSLSPTDLKRLDENPSRSSRLVLELLKKPDYLLSTILIINNLVNVSVIILSTYIAASLADFTQAPLLGFVVQVIAITFVILLFGDILPKILAASKPYVFANFMAYPLWAFSSFMRPVSYLLVRSTARVGTRITPHKNLSIDELSSALDISSGHHPDERKILKGIVSFGHTEVCEIMKPRLDVVALDISAGFNKLKSIVVESGYSRIPVYEASFDEIKGVLYVKDLLPYIQEDDDFQWQKLLRNPYFVPESKRINALLSEFQTNRIHMAIVVDEYGGTRGIVSLEDILEEIVGDISDESDDEVALYAKIDDKNYMFEAKILLNDFCKALGVDDSSIEGVRGEAETLAGLILEITSSLPQRNEVINYKNFRFTIDSVDNKRIRRVRVTLV